MASAPPSDPLPLFYQSLEPLSSVTHADWTMRPMPSTLFFGRAHAVPLTVEEFALAQRHYPIVFSVGANPVPLALMGLNEGVNVFTDEDGKVASDLYVPAYVRRYPFMLARLRPDADELSLCFDPTSDALGKYDEGQKLFENGQPGELVKGMLGFCEQFEQAGQRTAQFVQEIVEAKLLMDGEVTIQPEGAAQPFIYRGFQMISEEALKNLRGDVARKMIQSGAMAVIYAHLFSLSLISQIFSKQMAIGKVPTPQLAGV